MANLALNRPADASNYMYPYTPAKAVDGVMTPLARWVGASPLPPEPATPAPVWLRVDLGSTFWVNRWVVKQMGTVGWSPTDNLTDYKLQGSTDNSNWFDIDSVTNNSANSTDRTCVAKKARWVRTYITKGLRCNTNFASIVDLEVYEAANAPYLTSLTVNPGTLNPAFAPKNFDYTVSVSNSVSSITITPVAANNATITVGKDSTTYPIPANVPLGVGANAIGVTVTSADRTMTEKYNIIVNRAGSDSAVYLTNLVLKSPVDGSTIPMNPSFLSSILNYSADSMVDSIIVTPTGTGTIKVNGTTVSSGNPTTVNLPQSGINTILVTIQQGSGPITTYTLTINY